MHNEAIDEIETEIEALTQSAERCLTFIRAGKVTTAGGISILIGTGLLAISPVAILFGIGAVVGGIVVAGSNKGTLDELAEAISDLEAHRAGLIDGLELQAIGHDMAPVRGGREPPQLTSPGDKGERSR